MSETNIDELRADIEELNSLLKKAQRIKVQDILSMEIRKLETKLITLKEPAPAEATSIPTTSTQVQSRKYQVKLNGYGWDQSDKYIKVFVTLKNVQTLPKEQVYCKLTEKSMELHVDGLENKDYLLVIKKLLESINIEESHWKQKTDMVVIFLAKAQPNIKWSHVTEIEKKLEDQRNSRFQASQAGNPEDSILGMMKNMYDSGNDEMKQMIKKAMYESQHKIKTNTVNL